MPHPHRTIVPHSRIAAALAFAVAANVAVSSCGGDKEHTAAAICDADSLPFMHAKGISTFISDSGLIRYHLVAEEWDIYNREGELSTWKFMKGMLMQRFDKDFHVDLYAQSDTAYLHRQQIWELRGRVVIRNLNNEVFRTEELFWDMARHEMWNHTHMHITTTERELQGTEFRSNEQMTRYSVINSAGAFPVSDTSSPTEDYYLTEDSTMATAADTVNATQPTTPAATKRNKTTKFEPAPEKRNKY